MPPKETKHLHLKPAGSINRRSFLKAGAAAMALPMHTSAEAGAATTAGGVPGGTASLAASQTSGPAPQQAQKKLIGIQIGAVSFTDEGVEKCLDVLQERAGVNALMLAAFTYGRGIAGRQIPGQPLPDHGAQQYDTGTFHGGDYADVHPQYYRAPSLKIFARPTSASLTFLATSRRRPRQGALRVTAGLRMFTIRATSRISSRRLRRWTLRAGQLVAPA